MRERTYRNNGLASPMSLNSARRVWSILSRLHNSSFCLFSRLYVNIIIHDVQNLTQISYSLPAFVQAKDDVRHDHTPDNSPMSWVEPWTVDSPVYKARADTAEVANANRHRERHATLDVTTCRPTCPGKYDGDRGEHTTGSDNSTTVRNLYRGGTSRRVN